MTVVGNFLPGAVPRVLYADDARGFFCMDWIGDGWTNWKQEMLAGRADPRIAAGAGRVLGEIHRKTWGREDLRSEFETTENFFALRLEPYLIATARRTPALEGEFEREVARIRAERQCLVHGDFSPKNMLCRDGRVVILDCEVAWFGDPAFDVAFLVNHLFLKALSRPEHAGAFLDLATEFLAAYESALDPEQAAPVIAAAAHLLPMLLLARVDGKSPVEYLDKPDHQLIRDTVPGMLADTTAGFDAHADRWKSALAEERFKFRHEPQATEPDPGHAP
jgi:aminoglycoside phosphotransferase (APT) family kinase protein